MTVDLGSTVPRRELGRMLRDLRTEANMTLDGASDALECSRQKVWRIESGLGPVRSLDVKVMCQLYDVSPDLATVLSGLAAETKAKGWWHAYGDAIPDWFEPYIGFEATASRLRFHNDTMLSGILQARSYARGVYQHRTDISDEKLERQVDVRLRRQRILTRRLPSPPRVDVVLSEAALLRTVGSPETMAEQLRHLLELSELPHVSIRVLPLAAGLHDGAIAGTFVILDFPPAKRATPELPIVYSESLTGALYLDRPNELAAYERVWAGLDALAPHEEQSRYLIAKILREVHHG